MSMLNVAFQKFLSKYFTTGDQMLDLMLISSAITAITTIFSFFPEYFTQFKTFLNSLFRKEWVIIDAPQFYKCEKWGSISWEYNQMYSIIQWYISKFETPQIGTIDVEKQKDKEFVLSSVSSKIQFKNVTIEIRKNNVEHTEGKDYVKKFQGYRIYCRAATNKILVEFLRHCEQCWIESQKVETEWSQQLFILQAHTTETGGTSTSTIQWVGRPSRNEKEFSSIVLREGEKEALLQDVEEFYASEKFYKSRGISWSRGYLFYGLPGCGKTSLIRAISFKCKLDVYIMNLSTIGSDHMLRKAFKELPDRCALILEDIDCMGMIAHDREKISAIIDKFIDDGNVKGVSMLDSSISLSELLNQLDGICNSNGRLVIMTTNRVDVLDPALIRPGRIDYRLEMKRCKRYEISEFYKLYLEKEMNKEYLESIPDMELLTPSQVSSVFLCNRKNSQLALAEIKKLCKKAMDKMEKERLQDEEIRHNELENMEEESKKTEDIDMDVKSLD